jgi:uncharacterized protein YbjQ (UPF0145 family)
MKLFGMGGPAPDPNQVARQEASLESIRNGGLPLNAIDRLKEQAGRQGTPQHLFSSDLSVNEFALTLECGYLPLGQVMGSSVYNMGWQFMPAGGFGMGMNYYGSGELDALTQAHIAARHLAMNRMLQEAKLLNADGVVGVRIERRENDIEPGMIEFIAVGTAVRKNGAPPLGAGTMPFMSSLSGQHMWMLQEEGMDPVGFSFGTSVYFQVPDWHGQNVLWSWSNNEMTSLTQGFYSARELAMTRLSHDALSVGASGVVDVTVENFYRRYTDDHNNLIGIIVHFTAFGTAVARRDFKSDVDRVKPVLSLAD